MADIRVLSPEVYNLIAAGEVIERPYGAMKELVENSIDSGADRITIEIANGGFDLISVTDNGCGIAEKDVELAFVKHATSKLSAQSDLDAIQTLGFRGEALPSIAAISNVRMTTRVSASETGVCLKGEGGEVKDKTYVSANVGTKVEVRNLFANTPARKKFLKTPASESAEITKFVSKLILTNPNLSITYIADDKTVYSSNGNGREQAIFAVYGAECLDNCLHIAYSNGEIRIEGYIGNPTFSKPNRNGQTLSVNGRYVTDQSISAAIMQAYKPFLMTRQYPFYVLNLDIPCHLVDVNVHPKKTEVRFADARKVCSLFYHCVENALQTYTEQRSEQIFSEEPQTRPAQYRQEDFADVFDRLAAQNKIEIMNRDQTKDVDEMERAELQADKIDAISELGTRLEREVSVAAARANMGLNGVDYLKQAAPQFNEVVGAESAPSREDMLFYRARILGSAFKTYLILEIDDKLIFVDQHAAHERILFDRFMQNRPSDMQPIMFPYTFSVTDEEALFIEENISNFNKAGIELQRFGTNTFRITAVSSLLSDMEMGDFVKYLLSSIEEFKPDERELAVEKIAQKACKAAVKAGYCLSEYEIKYILKEVCDNKILQCPHGRPITVVFSKTQLEKMFKRIV